MFTSVISMVIHAIKVIVLKGISLLEKVTGI